MANLLRLEGGKLRAFLGWLDRRGVTTEEAEECLRDPDGTGMGGRRAAAFKNPPPQIEAAAPAAAPATPVLPPEPMWRPVEGNPNAVDVNLAHDPKLPFAGVEVGWRWGPQKGWVRLEKKDGDLYRDGKKVSLHLEPEQKPGSFLQGHTLKDRLQAKTAGVVLHPNEKTALMANPHLFPESWKVDAQGRILHTYFWAVGFRNGDDRCVEYVYFDDGAWLEDYDDLVSGWIVNDPSAVAS